MPSPFLMVVPVADGWATSLVTLLPPTGLSCARASYFRAMPITKELQQGHADGNQWVPAECDVSIRPGWFFHERENDKVKTVDKLTDLYYRSVGHNANFIINFPIDKEGLVYPTDPANIVDMYQRISSELKTNLLVGAKIKDQ